MVFPGGRSYIAIIIAALVCGCAAGGLGYPQTSAQMASVPDEIARIVFFRTRDSILYIARKATISIDGKKVGATSYGGFHYHDVTPGLHHLYADMWDAPGRCELTLAASPGQTYYFQVDPRNESFGAFAVAGFAAEIINGGVVMGLAGGLAGSAAESYGKDCGGAFKLYPVDPQTARSKMGDLNLAQ